MSNIDISAGSELTIEIHGEKHKVTLAEAQRLYDLLGWQAGIRRHMTPRGFCQPYWHLGRLSTPYSINVSSNTKES